MAELIRKVKLHTTVVEVDEYRDLDEMQSRLDRFFKFKHGQRETYTVHRGCIIVRSTDVHAHGGPVRRTGVWLYLPKGIEPDAYFRPRADAFCISGCADLDSIRQAKKLIDRVLDAGTIAAA